MKRIIDFLETNYREVEAGTELVLFFVVLSMIVFNTLNY